MGSPDSGAQYLLRFDDLCPTMDGARWRRFAPLLRRFGIRPILAVVPENLDPELQIAAPDPEFWAEMRAWQAMGATIGLHGYRHLCFGTGGGLVPLHTQTEFAGVPIERQREWIRAGLSILAGHGLTAGIWVAPRHGFDLATLEVLREAGIGMVSDGFARSPFQRGGLTWIPQQIWAPVQKESGVWTICLHANSVSDAVVKELERFLERFAAQFTSVDRVLAEWPGGRRSFVDRVMEAHMLLRSQLGRVRTAYRQS